MNNSPRIKFYCRSFNKELYLLSRGLYEQAGYPCIRLTDQTADGYFFKMLEDETCDIAINVDEDCFITDLDAVLALAKRHRLKVGSTSVVRMQEKVCRAREIPR